MEEKKDGVVKPHKENVSDCLKKKKNAKHSVNNHVLDGLQIPAPGES